jgi:hypothetical protein
VHVRLSRTSAILAVSYVLEGDIDRLRVPPPEPRCVTDKLWEHTCCEMFIARHDTAVYHEFNFSPSSEWAVYAFTHYRERAPLGDVTAYDPNIAVRRDRQKLQLDALIRLDLLSTEHVAGRLSLALAAVIEDQDSRLSYWALAHPPGRPDFHHRDSFTLTLDEVRN